MSDYLRRLFGGPTRKEIDMHDGSFAERVMAAFEQRLLTDGGFGASARLRVDQGQTGFFAGKMFRSYISAVLDKGGATPLYARFTSPIDFILWSQELTCTQGAVQFQAFLAPTFSGNWTQRPIIGINRMAARPTPYYVSPITLEVGTTGTFTGGTEVDLMQIRTASTNGQASNTGGSKSERGLPAGTYGLKFSILPGGLAVNDNAQMIYDLGWEDRP